MSKSRKTSQKFQSIRGTKDLLPEETKWWQAVERTIHEFMVQWGYSEIRTPAFEQTELFVRSVGEDSDIVTKQMYTFLDHSQNSLTLKPELTAPVIRAYIQHHLAKKEKLTKLYYIDTLFRQERPQAGRLRQFHQFGVEAIGSPHPEQDAEVITLAYQLLIKLGISELTLHLNSIGSPESRNQYRKALKTYLSAHYDKLSETSQKRLEKNPLRILDSKIPSDQEIISNAPKIVDFLEQRDQEHYQAIKNYLKNMGIPFVQNDYLVRGLDYYTRTTFEIISSKLGAQNALCGGGRYDGLVEELGGPATPGIGFAAGIERILLVHDKTAFSKEDEPSRIYIAAATERARPFVLKLTTDLRKRGFSIDFDTLRRSLKSQMREANRLHVKTAIIVGDQEIQSQKVQVKNLSTGEQIEVSLSKLSDVLSTDS